MRLEAHITSLGLLCRVVQQAAVISGTSTRRSISGNNTSCVGSFASIGQPRARAPIGAAGEREREAVPGEPVDSLDRLVVSVGPALLFMQRVAVMIEAHADHEPRPMSLAQAEKPRFDARTLHRLHGIGEHER